MEGDGKGGAKRGGNGQGMHPGTDRDRRPCSR